MVPEGSTVPRSLSHLRHLDLGGKELGASNQLLLSIGLALRAVHLQLPAAISSPGAESLPLSGLDQIGCC